jgi:hypothetical protein
MEKTPIKAGFNRLASIYEKLHFAVGGVALAGFFGEAITGLKIVKEATLAKIGLVAIGLGLGIKAIRGAFGGGRKAASPAPA